MKYVEINRCYEDGMHLPGCEYEINMNKLTNNKCRRDRCTVVHDIDLMYYYKKHFPRFEIGISINPYPIGELGYYLVGCKCKDCKYINKVKLREFRKEMKLLVRLHSI